jgi:hypothetical protein
LVSSYDEVVDFKDHGVEDEVGKDIMVSMIITSGGTHRGWCKLG